MDKIKQGIEWAQKRLEIQGKALDKTQIEVLTFALHEIARKNLDQPDVISNSRLHLPQIKKKARVKVCDACYGNGQFLLANGTIKCNNCNGTGKQTY